MHNGAHHIGGTAVPGLEAKPTIDILAGVSDLEAYTEAKGAFIRTALKEGGFK